MTAHWTFEGQNNNAPKPSIFAQPTTGAFGSFGTNTQNQQQQQQAQPAGGLFANTANTGGGLFGNNQNQNQQQQPAGGCQCLIFLFALVSLIYSW